MSTKTIIYIVVGFAIAYGIGYVYLKGMQTGTGTETGSTDARMLPSLADIMVKGYNEVEAKQILASLEAGRISTF